MYRTTFRVIAAVILGVVQLATLIMSGMYGWLALSALHGRAFAFFVATAVVFIGATAIQAKVIWPRLRAQNYREH